MSFIVEHIRGCEWRIYSHKVHMYIRGGSRSGMSHRMSLHTIGIGHMCVTQSDTFRYARLRYLIADDGFFGDGDGGRGRWRRGTIAAWILQTASPPYSSVTRATRALPAPAYIYDVRA